MNKFYYLATPYSKYPAGIEAAFEMACVATAAFIRAGIPVYSPIAHTHPVALHGEIDPLDHKIWLPADMPLLRCAAGLIVFQAESWEQSYGIKKEIEEFQTLQKPIRFVRPTSLTDGTFLTSLRDSL